MNNRLHFRFLGDLYCAGQCYVLVLKGISHCLFSPKKSSIVHVTFISHLNASVDLYMETWVKGEAG